MAPTPTPTNRWQLGSMYNGGLLNGQPFFVQPGGPGTPVSPHQANAVPWPEYPIPGLILNEYVPWWAPACGHSILTWKVIHEFDYTTGMDCALITCEVCTYVVRVIEPFSLWLDPVQNAIIVG